ncbi:uncharacterized protein HMPREF1541_07375 [Cyphellophora europaea CBS 101466]|uniref:Large ribosomal subunit protein eL14 domain-containing protein n=1 Tax=Cyphellophora europaea (strain CBS 101466) TaxID=1220924 RepID=W2RMQ3_CYPE1|nr:uncharacterized protein HMPREF1541_07375 [Cyphellophora europaea CBS 101466]ETN37752.1 hypothetical protein HMPREF1541_07375 [Cyphellophora europaea CBS 101466]
MSIEITEAGWRLIQAGRVVLIRAEGHPGKFGCITAIIDQNRVLVDGPSAKPELALARQPVHVNAISLTPIVIEKLPRDAGTGALRKLWEKQEIDQKIEESTFAKKRDQQQRRQNLSDFERFKVMRLKKQARFEIKKTAAKVKAAA